MCFSPQVDVVAGVVITVVAVDAARHCRSLRTAPLAALPAIFAFHTFLSAFVWWGLWGDVSVEIGMAALQSYLLIAFVLLPVYVPLAVLFLEPAGWRRPVLGVLALAGAFAALDFLVGLLAGRGEATACTAYIDFTITGTSSLAAVLYVMVTCGAFLLSGQRPLVLWGIVNATAVGLLALFANRGLPSLWCFWAACTSVFVAWFLRSTSPQGAVAIEKEPVSL